MHNQNMHNQMEIKYRYRYNIYIYIKENQIYKKLDFLEVQDDH